VIIERLTGVGLTGTQTPETGLRFQGRLGHRIAPDVVGQAPKTRPVITEQLVGTRNGRRIGKLKNKSDNGPRVLHQLVDPVVLARRRHKFMAGPTAAVLR